MLFSFGLVHPVADWPKLNGFGSGGEATNAFFSATAETSYLTKGHERDRYIQ